MTKKSTILAMFAMSAAASLFAQSVKESNFGKTKEGENVTAITLKNDKGMTVKLMNFGATILQVNVPDRKGEFGDVALGFDDFAPYEGPTDYQGALIGRYGNRIADGKFFINEEPYTLPKNDGPNCLHGGAKGFDKYLWKYETSTSDDAAVAVFTMRSPDGDQGFPGNLDVKVTYSLNNNNELSITYDAVTDKPTVVNLTQHCYFNLAGAGNGNILNHELTINADKYTPVNSTLIPVGKHRDVNGTPFDFRKPMPIGSRIEFKDSQLAIGAGYDHNFVLNKEEGKEKEMTFAARLYDPFSGRQMLIYTKEPGIQFYSGNFLKGNMIGKGGKAYHHRYGVALETQHFPNSPNQENFPSTLVKPGVPYHTQTIYKFSAQ